MSNNEPKEEKQEQMTAESSKENAPQKKTVTKAKRVDIFVPRAAAGDDQNVFIGINGRNYILPCGKTSSVPQEVADEFNRAQKAEEAASESSEALKAEGSQPINK